MRFRQRILSWLLAAALLLPALPAAEAEEISVSGSISATLRIDWLQSLEGLRNRDLQAELFQGGRSLGSLDLTAEGQTVLGGYAAAVTLRNRDGGSLGGGNWPGYLDIAVDGLPQGDYALAFTGEGYVPFRQEMTLQDCSKHVTLGTSDGTFTLGDVNGDGRVNTRDRELLSGALGSDSRQDLARYDLTGDGVVDIRDLTCLTRNLRAAGEAEVQDTYLLAPRAESLTLREGTQLVSGSLDSLLRNDGQTVTFSGETVSFGVALAEAEMLEELQIVSPDGPGALRMGTVAVEYVDGMREDVPFDLSRPEGVHAIGPLEGRSVVTISLGRRVAVKAITITVTRTEGGGYTTVESIQFLREIVPENPAPADTEVRNLTAAAGNEKVSLRWRELPNVSAYRVDYWLRDGGDTRSLQVDVPRAEVTGLENLKTYMFTVTPIDGSWTGSTCAPVAAVPQPAKAPSPPDMVSVGVLDSALTVSWKASENATFYQVYYKAAEGSFQPWGGQTASTSTTVTGLTNGVEYSIYITAGNSAGVSGPSRTALGTPAAADYSRPEGIPTEGVLDWEDLERVWLADAGNVSSRSYTAENPFREANMADGDFRTHWTAQSWGDGNYSRSKQVFASFRQPADISAGLWVPRLDGDYPANLRVYTVTVWREGDDLSGPGTLVAPNPLQGGSAADVDTWLGVRNNPMVTRFAVLPIEPVTDVVKIAITIEQQAYTAVSLSELMFLEYDPARCLPDQIAGLFDGELRTRLRAGVTQAEISALRQRLEGDEGKYYLYLDTLADELALAEELLQGQSQGAVLEGIDSRSDTLDGQRYHQGGSILQPLGAAARAGQEITIYATGIPAGQRLTVYASQFNAEASAWRAEVGVLSNGRNVLTVPQIGSQNTERGGSLYFTYSGPQAEHIGLHVRRAVDIPLLELADWYTLSEDARRNTLHNYVEELERYTAALNVTNATQTTNCLNVTEISTPTMLLSLPAKAVLGSIGQSRGEQVETLYLTVEAWEDLMHICKTTQGIDNTYAANDMETRQNIRCMQMFAGAFMYAAGNHIGIGYSSCGGMACGKPIRTLESGAQANRIFGWGIAHEIGHNMDKLGKAETTNNIYALMGQTFDGAENTLPSRLELSGKYPAIFQKTAQGSPGDSNNVFVQLGLYWQLHLAYDDGANPLDFYNRFFKAWKAKTHFAGASGYGDCLARTASAVAGRNLTEFFTRWGVRLSDETRGILQGYPEEPRAVWYLSDQSRRDRLAGVQPASGEIQVTANRTQENVITLEIQSNISGNVQGYEIRRSSDGGLTYQSIAFTSEARYEDVVGSANHRTYTYQAVAYDRLGYQVSEAKTNEVRIAYDKTVPADSYTLSRNGETVTFTLQEATPVTGLKIANGAGLSEGTFSVQITAEEGGEPVLALEGSFGQGNQAVDDPSSYLAYFWKPGTNGADTRVWTYDALTVTVTVPESVPEQDIQLVRYAGDDVAFLEEGFVGLLADDYDYGQGIIPAGTLIVAGTYRGNPVYQTIRLEGRFTQTGVNEEGEFVSNTDSRWLNGKAYLFAEIPADGEVSDISDGIFLFVPDVQREAELQGEESHCNPTNLLPSELRAVLSRTDLPDSAESQRVTAETLWRNSPGGEDLPVIVLEEGE